jgi:hypothetical protein
MIDGALAWRKLAAGKSLRLKLLAVGSGLRWLLHIEGKMVVLFSSVVVDEGLRWRRSTARGRCSERGRAGVIAGMRVEETKWKKDSSGRARVWNKVASMSSDDRCWVACPRMR